MGYFRQGLPSKSNAAIVQGQMFHENARPPGSGRWGIHPKGLELMAKVDMGHVYFGHEF
jgi:hypothetical protein